MSMNAPSHSAGRPRIAVIGGGIGGLATAAFLHRAGLTATVYEQAPELKEVGAGLVVAPNAGRLLRRLGVMDRFLRDAVPLEWGWEFRRWENGEVLSAERLSGVCERLYGEQTYVVHRADLLDAVRSAVPTEWVRLGARCTAVEELPDSALLRFADGSTVEADVVIGADGVHSVVRGTVSEPSPPGDSGICAFRAIVPAEQAPDFARRRAQTLWIGPGRHLVHYPISDGRAVNIVAFAPAGDYTEESWSATTTVEEFLAEFAGWDPRVTDLIKASGTPGRWALLDRAPLSRWSSARTTLLGDAAHPMFPFFAQGAAQATEATVFGPFFVEKSPEIPKGGDLAGGAPGEPCWVEGTVTDTDGNPVPGARLEVWEADADGFYDVQYDDDRTAGRAHLFTDEDGTFAFWGLTPVPYPIPHDGPVGALLEKSARSPMRAAHLHFLATAPGLRTLVTHIFVEGDQLLGSDAVFGVKESLVKRFEPQPPGTPAPDGRDLDGRTRTRVRFDIVLAPEATTPSAEEGRPRGRALQPVHPDPVRPTPTVRHRCLLPTSAGAGAVPAGTASAPPARRPRIRMRCPDATHASSLSDPPAGNCDQRGTTPSTATDSHRRPVPRADYAMGSMSPPNAFSRKGDWGDGGHGGGPAGQRAGSGLPVLIEGADGGHRRLAGSGVRVDRF